MAIVFLLLFLLKFATAQLTVCGNAGRTYKANSTYEANLRIMSSILPMNASIKTNRFATGTAGNAPDRVYGLTLCRGDADVTYCASCAATGFQDAQESCPFQKQATVYYDQCMLTFSNRNFLANTTNEDTDYLTNSQNFSTGDSVSARHFLVMLLNITAQSAANSTRRFSTSLLDVSSAPTMYCLAQCTPDLTASECSSCHQGLLTGMFQYVDGRQGGRIEGTRCNMRYEEYRFFSGDPVLRIDNKGVTAVNPKAQQSSAAPPPRAKMEAPEHLGRTFPKSSVRKIAISAALLSMLLCLLFSFVWMRKRRKAAVNRLEEDALVWRLEENNSEFTLFDFSHILNATANFSEDNCLGQGGFGSVYKGQLPDGIEIAVKRLATHSGQGFTEFKTEVELIAKLQHNNLVRLLGCCIQREEKLLVYEYLPNKSLDFFIFGGNRSVFLDWNKCCAIIEGIAQGLLYLHKHSRLRVIHRDLKASNILLDQDMNPKISDFGLARIFSLNEKQGNTKRVVGTFGYMSPEYASEGIYSTKSDVFSFGVLLLEILSGKRNSGNRQYGDFLNLLGYAWQLWEGGRWLELIESSIAKEIHQSIARKYINIVLMCVQENADDRPTMSDVVTMLSSESVILPEPKHPAYCNLRVSKVVESESGEELCSVNCVTITDNQEGR